MVGVGSVQNVFTVNQMNSSFIKIFEGFTVSWNIDAIVGGISSEIEPPRGYFGPYFDPSGIAHWQNYSKTNIAFARNFFRNFKAECAEVAFKLKEIQKNINPDNDLLKLFVEHTVVPQKVNIIRAIGGKSVAVHCDTTRYACINIGLKNSNTFRTRISNNTNIENFYNEPTETYTMNDGDAYLISIRNAHCVEALTDVPLPRYIITYTIS